MLLSGLKWTIVTALCAWVLALILGTIVGVMRSVPSKGANTFASAYVEFFPQHPHPRAVVSLVLRAAGTAATHAAGMWLKQLPNASFWTAFIDSASTCRPVSPFSCIGIAALRAGRAWRQGAWPHDTQTYRYVLLPMAFRIILPPLTSEFLNTIKNSPWH